MKRKIAWILALLVLLSALSVSALAANGSFWMRDEKGELTGNGSSAVYKCTTESGGGAWERGLFINGVCALESGTTYRICFDITADQDTDFEVCYNKDTNWGEDEKAFGGEYELKATAEKTTVTHEVTAAVSGTLNLRIDLGKAALNTTVTVSNVTVEKIQQAASVSVGTVGYPQAGGAGSFEMRDAKGELTGDGTYAAYKCTSESGGEAWERGLFINNLATLTAGETYTVRFDVEADKQTDFEVCYNKDGNWGESEKAYGAQYELSAGTEKATVAYELTPEAGGVLSIRIDLGKAAQDTLVTISNVQVVKDAETVAAPTYPTIGAGSFEMRDGKGELTGNGTNAVYKCTTESGGGAWERGLFINNAAVLTAGTKYAIRFDVEADKQTDFEVCYNKDGNWGESEKAYGAKYELSAGTEKATVAYELTPEAGGVLSIRIDLGKAEQNTTVTVSNVKIEAVGEVTYESIGNVSYPTVHSAVKTVKTEEKKITVTMQDGVKTPPIFAASYDENGYMVSVYRAEIQDGRYEIATNEAVASYKWKIFFVDEKYCPRYESYEIAK